jgi:hypothetical protein
MTVKRTINKGGNLRSRAGMIVLWECKSENNTLVRNRIPITILKFKIDQVDQNGINCCPGVQNWDKGC